MGLRKINVQYRSAFRINLLDFCILCSCLAIDRQALLNFLADATIELCLSFVFAAVTAAAATNFEQECALLASVIVLTIFCESFPAARNRTNKQDYELIAFRFVVVTREMMSSVSQTRQWGISEATRPTPIPDMSLSTFFSVFLSQ